MKDLTKIFLTLILLFSVLWIISFAVPKIIELYKTDNIEIKTDTVVTEKHDTILLTDTKPYTVIKYKTVVDTLKTTDSVKVPVEVPLSLQKYEGDTLSTDGTKVHYRANVTGYKASLDSLWFDIAHKDSIFFKEVIKYKKKRGFKIAPYAGIGFNPIEKNFVPTIGVGITYNF